MRILTALAAAAALSLAACGREVGARADVDDADVQEELAEAGEAVGEAAVEVGQAARVAVQDAAANVDENAEDQEQPEAEEPAQP